MDESIDDGLANDRIFKQLKPTLWLDLRSDDERRLVVTLLKNIDQGSSLLVGIVSQTEIVEDQDLGLDQTAHVVEIAPSGFGGLDFFEQKVDRQKLSGVALLAKPFAQSDSQMGFTQAGFTDD